MPKELREWIPIIKGNFVFRMKRKTINFSEDSDKNFTQLRFMVSI